MNSTMRLLAGLVMVVLVALGAIIVQAFVLRPAGTVKLAVLPEGEYDPAVWGEHYPLQYRSYLKNREMAPSPTGFGGSVNVQKSEKEPEILVNFRGMPFSLDYSEDRGHPWALEDLKESKRINQATAGACMTCKTADLGDIYREKGWDYAKTPLVELLPRLRHPVTCANCHDPRTMGLHIVNPAFTEAMSRRGVDVKKASRQDMRSYVCGQCHSEYYFEPASKKVVFPWDSGYLPEQMYAYYAGKPAGFEQDWIHPDSGTKMLKAQHPDFETWAGGVHGTAGAACADCHMPYMREKGRKYSSHWVTSPLKHISASCTTCHDRDETWLLERVRTVQTNCWQLQRIAGQTVAGAHEAIGRAAAATGVDPARLEKARELLRQAQWFWDMVAAENGMGFHNPDQVMNTLGRSIDMAHQAASLAVRPPGTGR